MDLDEIFLLCFQENFHDLLTAIYIDSQKMSPIGCKVASIPYYLSCGVGANPRPSAWNGSVHTYYTSFHVTFIMGVRIRD